MLSLVHLLKTGRQNYLYNMNFLRTYSHLWNSLLMLTPSNHRLPAELKWRLMEIMSPVNAPWSDQLQQTRNNKYEAG